MEPVQYGPIPQDEQSSSGNKKFLALVTLTTVIGSFLFGYDTGIIGAANLYIEDEWDLSVLEIGVIVSITIAGAIFGALMSAPLADAHGRKLSIYLADFFFLLGSIMMALAHNTAVLIAGRLIVGFGIGMAAMIAPVYLSETAPAHIRGGIVAMTILFVTGGQFIAYAVAIALGDQWRWMFGIGAIPPVFQFIVMIFMPESPRFYVKKGNIEQARKALMLLRIPSEAPNDPALVENELEEIQNSLSSELKSGFFANAGLLFKTHRYQAITGIVLLSLNQFVGINCAMYYGPQLMQMAGFNDGKSQAIVAALPIAGVNFLGSNVAVFFIDKIGRRGILLWSLPGIFVALVGLAASFGMMVLQGFSGGEYAILAFLLMYIAFFSIGMGPTPWVIISEIIPLEFRSTASSLGTAANWIANFAISMAFLPMTSTSEGMISIWLILASFALFSFLWVFVRLPETKGHHLEEITSLLQKEDKEN